METKVYFPRKSFGWIFLAIFVFLILFTAFSMVYLYLTTGILFFIILSIAFFGIGFPSLIILFSLPNMKYVLDDKNLIMSCGFLKYIVPFSSIRKVSKRDLQISLWSSFRFPGLALFTVPYVDVGNVKMCATSASKGIILIESDSGLYGITPLDEDTFISDLMNRLRR